jgi:hypothetical protein
MNHLLLRCLQFPACNTGNSAFPEFFRVLCNTLQELAQVLEADDKQQQNPLFLMGFALHWILLDY